MPALSRLPVHVFELWHLVQTSRTEHQAAPGFRGKGNGGQEEINWHGKWDGEVRWEMEIRIRGPRRAHFIFYLISSLLLCVSDRYNIVPGVVQLLCNCRLVFRYVWVVLCVDISGYSQPGPGKKEKKTRAARALSLSLSLSLLYLYKKSKV